MKPTLLTYFALLFMIQKSIATHPAQDNGANPTQGSCVSSYPYYQNFDSGVAADWLSVDDPNNTHNASFEIINSTYLSRADDDNQFTLKRPFPVNWGSENQLSYIETPCFNLNSLINPILSFDIINDGGAFALWVEYSTDGGLNYQKLGSTGAPFNWYQNQDPGFEDTWQYNGFPYDYVYHGNNLRKVLHSLTFLNTQTVIFRIYYQSTGNFTFQDYEIGIDNFSIFDHDLVPFEATADYSCQYYTTFSSSEPDFNLWSFTQGNFNAIQSSSFQFAADYYNFYWLTNDAYPGYVYFSYFDNVGYTTPLPSTTSAFICSGDSVLLTVESGHDFYQWFRDSQPIGTNSNQIYAHQQGSYYAQFSDANGCGPIIYTTLYLPLVQSSATTINASICQGDSYTFGSQTLSTPGTYIRHLTNAVGCDSTITLHLNVNTFPTASTITAQGNTTFCNGGSVILSGNNLGTWSNGSTANSITVSTSGNYFVTNANGCGSINSNTINVVVNPCNNGPVTQLRTEDCNKQNYRISSNNRLIATYIGAGTYEFEFKNVNTNAVTNITSGYTVYLNNPGLNLTVPAQYEVRVRYSQAGNWTNYGSTCTIGILDENAPVSNTKIRTADCGKLNYRINSNNRIIADPVLNAQLYEFEFSTAGSGNTNVVTIKTQNSNVLFLNTLVPSLNAPAQYDVRVRAKVFNVWGNFATSCLIGISGVAREESDSAIENEQELSNQITTSHEVALFPNPSNESFNLYISSNENELYNIKITDLLGNEIAMSQIPTNVTYSFGNELSQGVYLLKLMNHLGELTVIKFIKTY